MVLTIPGLLSATQIADFRQALESVDVEEDFASELLRRHAAMGSETGGVPVWFCLTLSRRPIAIAGRHNVVK